MEAKNSGREVEHGESGEKSPRAGAGKTRLAKASPRAACSALNRLIVAGRGEIMALNAAARIVDGTERRARLLEQVERRRTFQRDLMPAVTALGGVPATHAATGAKLAAVARRVRELAIGPHDGDAYAVCARATQTTEAAYAKALKLELPADVTFGLERQYAEIEWDRRELRRLRWGASLTPLPGRSLDGQSELSNVSTPTEPGDARALEVWSEEGGPGPRRPGGGNIGVGVARAMP